MSKSDDSRSIETRDQLVQAAIELFGLAGYDGTSTRAISSKAGASLGAIPYHFKTKENLYLAAAETIAEQVSRKLGPVLDAFETEIYSDKLSRKRAI